MNLVFVFIAFVAIFPPEPPPEAPYINVCNKDATVCHAKHIDIKRDKYGNLSKETIRELGGKI